MSGFLATFRKMRDLRSRYRRLSEGAAAERFHQVIEHLRNKVIYQFRSRRGNLSDVPKIDANDTLAERAYYGLQGMARRAESEGDEEKASRIRDALHKIDVSALENFKTLSKKHGIPEAPAARSTPTTSRMSEPAAAAMAAPSPAGAFREPEWFAAYRNLGDLAYRFSETGRHTAHKDFKSAYVKINSNIMSKFENLGGEQKNSPRERPTAASRCKPGTPWRTCSGKPNDRRTRKEPA